MSGKVTLGEVTRGDVDIVHLAKLNALLDYQGAAQHAEAEKAKRNR